MTPELSPLVQALTAFLAALVVGRVLFTDSWFDAAPVAVAVGLGVGAALVVGERLWD